MSIVMQSADPQFGIEQPPVSEALAALARQQRPDLLVLSGDSSGCCLIEQWDLSTAELAFVRAEVTQVRPARA